MRFNQPGHSIRHFFFAGEEAIQSTMQRVFMSWKTTQTGMKSKFLANYSLVHFPLINRYCKIVHILRLNKLVTS